MKPKYTAEAKNYEHRQPDDTSWWGVSGPGGGAGFGYYSHTLSPGLSMATKEEAERAATLCSSAYGAGYAQAKSDIRQALGLER